MALLTGDEIIEIAMRLEEKGEAFYNTAAAKATTAEIRTLFEELAIQEQYHRRAFQQMGRDLVQQTLSHEQWDQFQAYAGALLEQRILDKPEGALGKAAGVQSERDALQAALGFEKETLVLPRTAGRRQGRRSANGRSYHWGGGAPRSASLGHARCEPRTS